MDKNKDYYKILEINRSVTDKEIKSAYYRLSKLYHPDKNGNELLFHSINEAYIILSDVDKKAEYDSSSRFGNSYNEYYELFEIDFNFSYEDSKRKLEKFKKNEILDIHLKVDDNFDGSISYERWVRCKGCDGTGKDHSSKILIKDKDGKVLKTFDSDDGCDFCDGTGKDYTGGDCGFCLGKGKVGLNPCKKCNGDRRILGKQKLSGIKLTGKETKIDAMGHCSKTETGKSGYLLIIKQE